MTSVIKLMLMALRLSRRSLFHSMLRLVMVALSVGLGRDSSRFYSVKVIILEVGSIFVLGCGLLHFSAILQYSFRFDE